MFTGLVQSIGRLRQAKPGPEAVTLVIDARLPAADRIEGASVAVNGVCLTVTGSSATHFEADAAFETLDKTTLGALGPGDAVNLEPSLRLGDPLGGHLVSGHVDGVGRVAKVSPRGDAREIEIEVPPALAPFIATKGSVCVDGTSLTVNAVTDHSFSVGIIPHTLRVTTLGELTVGRSVNLEVDLLARYVARLLELGRGAAEPASGGLSMKDLVEAGFVTGRG